MAAHVYIDGFAPYHMCFRRSANQNHLKWLDLRALSAELLPNEDVDMVRYYTARVGDTPEDPQRASRQDTYPRALATLPGLEICQGNFVKSKREVRLVSPPLGIDPRQTAWVRQEKGSDVALATHLLTDVFGGGVSVALLLTNDSDFVEPIRTARERFSVRVVISPDDSVVNGLPNRHPLHAPSIRVSCKNANFRTLSLILKGGRFAVLMLGGARATIEALRAGHLEAEDLAHRLPRGHHLLRQLRQ